MSHRLKKAPLFLALLALTALLSAAWVALRPESSAPSYLYKTTFVRAAPGKLLELIDLYKSRMATYDASGDERPFWWRHTQGDQWDLMLLFPMRSYTEYYSAERAGRRNKAAGSSALSPKEFARQLNSCSAWREDVFVLGPPVEIVKKTFADTAYYHIEICVALPGKQEELFKEREMENIYQVATGRPENLIFVRDQGAAWDFFTLGCYRDLKHWASSATFQEQREAAARRPVSITPTRSGLSTNADRDAPGHDGCGHKVGSGRRPPYSFPASTALMNAISPRM
jgi:hypothetical protein